MTCDMTCENWMCDRLLLKVWPVAPECVTGCSWMCDRLLLNVWPVATECVTCVTWLVTFSSQRTEIRTSLRFSSRLARISLLRHCTSAPCNKKTQKNVRFTLDWGFSQVCLLLNVLYHHQSGADWSEFEAGTGAMSSSGWSSEDSAAPGKNPQQSAPQLFCIVHYVLYSIVYCVNYTWIHALYMHVHACTCMKFYVWHSHQSAPSL